MNSMGESQWRGLIYVVVVLVVVAVNKLHFPQDVQHCLFFFSYENGGLPGAMK